jgi:flagellar export protein FliJ
MSRALGVVARLRRLAIDEARIELAARRVAEDRAEAADREAREAMDRERQVASTLVAEDKAFATWLPGGLAARDGAHAALARAQDAAEEGRAALADARASGEAVERMLATIAAEHRAEANRREQAALDEVGQRRRQER